jgi:hypothetical protein
MNQTTFALIVGTLLRSVVMAMAGWLVARGMLPQGSVEEWTGAVALTLVAVLWSLYQKYVERTKLMVALTLPSGSTENDVTSHIATGVVTPSVLTPPNTVPGVPKVAS